MDNNPELLQSDYWSRVKERHGWRSFFQPYHPSTASLFGGNGFRALYRSVGPAGSAGLLYLGHAFPLSPEGEHLRGAERQRLIGAAADEIDRLRTVVPGNTLFARWDVPWDGKPGGREDFAPFSGTRIRVQPPDTVIIDLAAIDDGFPSDMKKKTRYNIRLAEKRGVSISRSSPDSIREDLARWYAVYRETAERDRIGIHPESYYQDIFAEAVDGEPQLHLYLAHHGDDLLGGIVVTWYRKRATYLYGASSNRKRNLMASYLLQWRAIAEARDAGCASYDLFGIPPSDNPSHPMHGLYRFKTGFGGRIVHRPGCVDRNFRVLPATLFHGAESVRQWYFHTLRKWGRR